MIAIAALIAAVSFAALTIAGVFALIRLARLLTDARQLITRGDDVFARANAAVERANAQLDRTDAVTASMNDLGDGMAELAGQVQTVAGIGRSLAASPAGKVAALAHGVRHAVDKRRRTIPGQLEGAQR